MAKVSFTKLGLKVNQDIKTIEFNEQTIEVKQYLSVNEKLELISNVINLSADDNNFANPVKIDMYTILEIINYYTNINFTEKQKEDSVKLYDLFISTGLIKEIISAIPEEEYNALINGIKDSVESVYKYRNSFLGLLEIITSDYSKLELNANSIYEKIADPDNLAFLKEVIDKLG